MRFCLGRSFTAERPLLPAERAALATSRRRARVWLALAIAVLAAQPAGVIGLGLVAEQAAADDPAASPALASVAALLLLIGLPVTLRFLVGAVRTLRALARDQRAGRALLFGSGPAELAVLAESRLALAEGGVLLRAPRLVLVGDAAPPPPPDGPAYAVAAADLPAWAQASAWEKRPLTAEERAELGRHAARAARVPLGLAAVVVALAALIAARQDRAGGLLLALAVGAGGVRYARTRSAGRRLLADAEEGWVLRAASGEAAGQEILPGTGAAWSKAGIPAVWRLLAR